MRNAETRKDTITEKDKYNSLDWVIFQNKLIRYTGHDEHVIVPERVTVIGEMAFWNSENQPIKKITLPRHLTRIEHGAFCNCVWVTWNRSLLKELLEKHL